MLVRLGIITASIGLLIAFVGCENDDTYGEQTVAEGFSRPTDFVFTPGGRILVAEQGGTVRVVKDGVVLPEPFIVVEANAEIERGLLGIAIDPAFAENGYVYLYYTFENNPEDPGGPKTNQLLRVTAEGDVARPGSELVLLGSTTGDPTLPSCNDFPNSDDCIPAEEGIHSGGGIGFTQDGKILLGTGDGTLKELVQDVKFLGGKILRINPDGSIPEDNPFYAGPGEARSKVWAFGFRNPFKLVVRPDTGTVLVGDVGTYFDEIDAVDAGANYGWPCFSGPTRYGSPGDCDELEASGSATAPVYSYETQAGAAVMLGPFYPGGDYPDVPEDALLFADYVRGTISSLTLDENDDLIDGSVQTFYEDADTPVALEIGLGGDLYYLSIERGAIQRLCYKGCQN